MRGTILFLLVVVLAQPCIAQVEHKLKIAIVELRAGVGRSSSQVDGLSAMLTSALFATGKFDIIERNQIQKVLREQHFSESDELTDAQQRKIGRILGAEAILLGTVNYIVRDEVLSSAGTLMSRGEYSVELRIVSTADGKVLSAAGAEQSYRTKRDLIQQVSRDLARRLRGGAVELKPIDLLGLLDVYPEDVGSFREVPTSVIIALNNAKKYGFNDWRLPTPQELDLLRSNFELLGMVESETYASSKSFQKSGAWDEPELLRVRLVRKEGVTGQTYCENPEYDFGTISLFDSSTKQKTFEIKNSDLDHSFWIDKASASCSCIKAQWSTSIIPPGEMGYVWVTFDASGRQGTSFRKKIVVYLSNGEKLSLYVKGKVL